MCFVQELKDKEQELKEKEHRLAALEVSQQWDQDRCGEVRGPFFGQRYGTL